jgi:hypothetical protein
MKDHSVRARGAREGTALLAACVSMSACTHLEYTRSIESGEALINGDEFGAPSAGFEGYQRNEVRWLDPTGAVCAGATTGLAALNAATDARDEAIKKGRTTYEYEYNVYAPVGGLYCGGYYRWGGGSTAIRAAPAQDAVTQIEDRTATMDTWELGFVAEGREQLAEFNWLTYSFGFELAVGKYDWATQEAKDDVQIKDYDDPILFRTPLSGGLGFYPPFFFGAGVEARAGADLIAWAFTAEVGEWYEKFDYDVRAAYQLKLFNPLILGVAVGYENENLHWGEYWLRRQGPYANLSAFYVF